MSRLGELVEQLCPNGVEYKRVDEVTLNICSGGTPSRKNSSYYGGGIPWLRTQEVDFSDIHETELTITEDGLNNSSAKWIPANCLIVAMYGATAGKVAINRIALTTNQACCNLRFDETEIILEYAYYWFYKNYRALKGMGEGSQGNISVAKIKAFPIPVPPVDVQCEIVRILDSMQELDDTLSKELETREKQLRQYSETIYRMLQDDGGNVVPLGSIAKKVSSGKTKERLDEGKYIVYGSTGPIAFCNTPEYSGKRILVARVGANCGHVHAAEGEYGVTDNTLTVILSDAVSFEFVLYQMECMGLNRLAVGGGQPLITGAVLKRIELVLPELTRQKEIAEKMSHMRGLISSIDDEREQRRRQFEYYRDKLLDFPEKAE